MLETKIGVQTIDQDNLIVLDSYTVVMTRNARCGVTSTLQAGASVESTLAVAVQQNFEGQHHSLQHKLPLLPTWDGVVDVGGDVVLQKLYSLVDDVLACTICLLLPQVSIGADNILQLVREIILTPGCTTRNTEPQCLMQLRPAVLHHLKSGIAEIQQLQVNLSSSRS